MALNIFLKICIELPQTMFNDAESTTSILQTCKNASRYASLAWRNLERNLTLDSIQNFNRVIVGRKAFAYYEKQIFFYLLCTMPHAKEAFVAGSFALHCKMLTLGHKVSWTPGDVDVWFGPLDIAGVAQEIYRILNRLGINCFIFQHSLCLHWREKHQYLGEEDTRNFQNVCRRCRSSSQVPCQHMLSSSTVVVDDIVDIYFTLEDHRFCQKAYFWEYLRRKYGHRLTPWLKTCLNIPEDEEMQQHRLHTFQKLSLIRTIKTIDNRVRRCPSCAGASDAPVPHDILRRFDLDIVSVGFVLDKPLTFIEIPEHSKLLESMHMHLQKHDRNSQRERDRIDKYASRGFTLVAKELIDKV